MIKLMQPFALPTMLHRVFVNASPALCLIRMFWLALFSYGSLSAQKTPPRKPTELRIPMTDQYQTGAVLNESGWNHVKLVVSGRQLKVYVNDMTKPAMIVPELEGPGLSGGISLNGAVNYANLDIRPDATAGIELMK
ncbi:hypothetical protein [Arsenicibacter rosenii]|uniref:3-keto-disaccharide hydrolase domain-containing protein n=1 Tax=Arsenicibacter rosenii TaxID=1750698 RepID=A0A1S2VAN8_9BACT|nr:hypothetical protein [Arsenicibacter rosenii]OIN55763.1 hypothetical protein BLX24_28315 [Arsenicibacter rosenii]